MIITVMAMRVTFPIANCWSYLCRTNLPKCSNRVVPDTSKPISSLNTSPAQLLSRADLWKFSGCWPLTCHPVIMAILNLPNLPGLQWHLMENCCNQWTGTQCRGSPTIMDSPHWGPDNYSHLWLIIVSCFMGHPDCYSRFGNLVTNKNVLWKNAG